MVSFTVSLDREAARRRLGQLVASQLPPFPKTLKRLNDLFLIYAATCPAPLPAPGLVITPEIRCQCEIYLPVSEVSRCFNRLYCSAMTYPPILSSTPFHNALSWADVYAALPHRFQFSANPARLLAALFDDRELMTEFLFASFLPHRFYGGFNRYPRQRGFIGEWLGWREKKELNCLDAACGTGEETYGLAGLLLESGFEPEAIRVEGWTIDPLEIWAAAHARFPHDPAREAVFRQQTAKVFKRNAGERILFRCADLRRMPRNTHLPEVGTRFDLILCNGLLGGPIIHQRNDLIEVVGNLVELLCPGGLLLAADRFHGGWKKRIPEETLGDVFKACGLMVQETGEGIGGQKR